MTTLLCDSCQKNYITLPPDAVVSEFCKYLCATCCDGRRYGRTEEERQEIENIGNEIEIKLRQIMRIENEDYEIAA
jgi:hypothetical protein